MMEITWPSRAVGRLSRLLSRPSTRRNRRPSWCPSPDFLEPRELLSTTQNFSGGGTTFSLQQIGGPPPPEVVPGGPTGSYLALATQPTNVIAGNDNSISFVTSDPGTYNQVIADWDFRVTQTVAGQRGVGMSFALLNTGNYGTSGQAASVLPQQGIYNGSLAFGFDTAENNVFLSLNGAIVTAESLTGRLDLASGQFIRAHAEISFTTSTVTLVLTPSLSGSAVTVFNSTTVPELEAYQSRVSLQARNSTENFANFDLDNVNVQFVGLRQAGTIAFGSANYTAAENQGFALIDIQRLGGTAGAITVGFVAADGTARNGVNYVAVSGNLTFSEGQTTRTIVVPIIPDGRPGVNTTVSLYLRNPTLAAPLGSPIVATLTIVDTDPVPPTVATRVQLVRVRNTRRVSGFRLDFSQPMDPISSQDVGNYQVSLVGRRGARRTISISQAILDPSGTSVTLYRADLGRVHLTNLIQILVRGRPATGLKNTSGVFLAGTGGEAGTDALLTVRA